MANASIGTSVYTTVAAFSAADEILGPERINTPVTDAHRDWLDGTYVPCAPEVSKIPEIASQATTDAGRHVAFLARHGWEAQCTNVPVGGFLTAAVLDVLVQWEKTGKQCTLPIDGTGQFQAARLTDGAVALHRNTETQAIVATLYTKTGDEVLLTMPDREPTDARDLQRLTEAILMEEMKPCYDNEGIIFPMVDLVSKQSIDWLVGLQCRSPRGQFHVDEAVQQATLKMNHEGARARAADEMVMRCMSTGRRPYVIDRPFLVIFRRPGLTHALFSAYASQDAWKNPGGLGV